MNIVNCFLIKVIHICWKTGKDNIFTETWLYLTEEWDEINSLCNWKSRGRMEVRVGLIQGLKAISVLPSMGSILQFPSCTPTPPWSYSCCPSIPSKIPKFTCTPGALRPPYPPEQWLLGRRKCTWKAHGHPGKGRNTHLENLPISRKKEGWELLESCDG